jgi:hypothetical protein
MIGAPMKHPAFLAAMAALVVLLAAFVPALWRTASEPPAAARTEMPAPWRVDVDAAGRSRVFNLELPGATLETARRQFGDDLQIGLMARRGQPGVLEAYLESFTADFISGRLLLAADADAGVVAGWQARARATPVDADTVRYTLAPDDLALALRAPLVGITFIPVAQLDAATLRARFGEPAERLASGERLVQWMYPAKGLAVVLDSEGREVLQYVAPADFERRLRAPLIQAGATPAP